mgnify:CR=1 FL=1
MSKAIKTASSLSWLLRLVTAVIGSIAGALVTTQVNKTVTGSLGSGKTTITYGELVSLVVAIGLVLFGSRIHTLVRWFGVGWFVGSLTPIVQRATAT